MDAAGVKEFFEQIAADWDTMRLAYYDERVGIFGAWGQVPA